MLNFEKLSYWERKQYTDTIDFLIVGSGIVGYSTAIHLRKAYPNASIVIIERGYLPSGASSKNAGFACFGSVTELYDDIQQFGEETVWETVALRWEGLKFLRKTIGDEELDLHIHGSWDLITEKEIELFNKALPHIDHYNQKLEEITGEKDVYSVDEGVAEKFGFNHVKTSFFNRLEGQIDTGKMNTAFYKKAVELDIRILFGIEANDLSSDASHVEITTNHGSIFANSVAICTNGFAKQLLKEEDVSPARAQVLITKPIENLPIKGTFHYQEGYYYFRNIDNRVLFGGGRNLDKSAETTTEIENSPLIINELKKLLNDVILPSTPYEIDYHWAGIMGVGNTKQPIVKMISPAIACGVRLGGMGVAIGTLTGQKVAALLSSQTKSNLNAK